MTEQSEVLRCTETEGSITFTVRVVARASRTEATGEHEGALRVRIAAPPVDGAANDELTRYLSRALGVAPRDVQITSGHTSKTKRIRVNGADRTRLLRLAEEE